MMKFIQAAILLVIVGLVGSGVAESGQNFFYQFKTTGNALAPANLDKLGNVVVVPSTYSALNIASTSSVVKAGAGRIGTINILAETGTTQVYDAATTGAVSSVNEVAVIPATVGVYKLDFPVTSGIVINAASSTVAISYQ